MSQRRTSSEIKKQCIYCIVSRIYPIRRITIINIRGYNYIGKQIKINPRAVFAQLNYTSLYTILLRHNKPPLFRRGLLLIF